MSYQQGDYVRLGKSCHPSMRILTDNRKFLPPQARVYQPDYTYMYQYPGQSHVVIKRTDKDKKSYGSCCGRK